MGKLKGYACWIGGYENEPSVQHATTASKARAAYWRYLADCCPDLKIHEVRVRRSPAHDVSFPDLPQSAANLTADELNAVLHAYGGGSHVRHDQRGYRNHYCCAPDHPTLNKLVARGLMTGPHSVDTNGSTGKWVSAFFYLTDEGKVAARALIGARDAAKMAADATDVA